MMLYSKHCFSFEIDSYSEPHNFLWWCIRIVGSKLSTSSYVWSATNIRNSDMYYEYPVLGGWTYYWYWGCNWRGVGTGSLTKLNRSRCCLRNHVVLLKMGVLMSYFGTRYMKGQFKFLSSKIWNLNFQRSQFEFKNM